MISAALRRGLAAPGEGRNMKRTKCTMKTCISSRHWTTKEGWLSGIILPAGLHVLLAMTTLMSTEVQRDLTTRGDNTVNKVG